MMKCDTNNVFNGSECEFQCPKEGKFAHPDSAKFYDCVYSGTKLMANVISCPKDKVFNANVGICLTETV